MSNYISPIAIDLGAKNTGVLFSHYKEGEEPLSHKGVTFILEGNLTVSQKDRLTNRHRVRGQKRRKLAKRLFFLILEKEFGLKQTQLPIWEFIRGLLNRRGFTYLQEENQDEIIEIPKDFAKLILPKQFKDCEGDVLDYIRDKANENEEEAINFWKFLRDFETEKKDESKKKKSIEVEMPFIDLKPILNNNEEFNLKDAKNFIKQIKETAKGLIKEIEQGNKSRKKYLEEIKFDIETHTDIDTLLATATKKITKEKFYTLLGHISNLQLRVLRKYFNDEAMSKEKDYWEASRFKKIFYRYLKSWHTPKGKPSRENQIQLLSELKKSEKSILEIFAEFDPKISIPPFEDQNNRRIPTCQTLFLSARHLDLNYKGWREITKKLAMRKISKANGKIEESVQEFYGEASIEEVLKELRKSLQSIDPKTKKTDSSKIPFDKDSILLHRVLETNKLFDIYHIRLQVERNKIERDTGKEGLKIWQREKIKKLLEGSDGSFKANEISKPEKDLLLTLAEKFYSDTDDARNGIWDKNNSVLEICNAKTKHRNKMQQEVVEQILKHKFESKENFESFKNECWNSKLKGQSTVKSLCKGIEETRKEFGNFFNEGLQKYKRKIYAISKAENKTLEIVTLEQSKKLKDDEKSYFTVSTNVELISEAIRKFLNQENAIKAKYSNPFSLAQIYNILEGEQHGFHKISSAAEIENSWRGELDSFERTDKEGNSIIETLAKATRLSSDTGRPFDGQLNRIVTRIAKEISDFKIKQINENFSNKDSVEIPILMENNQFSFTEEILDLKKASKKAKDKAGKNSERSEGRLKTKEQRIKDDSGGICPYMGSTLGDGGEVDHIIPRSKTKESRGTILNSELNLLYCSSQGNQAKGNQEYTLENIHSKFLKKHFSTTDIQKIKTEIRQVINEVKLKNREQRRNYIIADSLEKEQRLVLKLALFDLELRKEILPFLQNISKAIVNGTQAWLFKNLKTKIEASLQKVLPNAKLKITPHYFGTKDDEFALSELRKSLGSHNSNYVKKEFQPEGSHIIDAAMVFAQGLIYSSTGKMNLKSPLIKEELDENGQWLESLLPTEIEIKYLERKSKYRKENPESSSLFKAGMYAERFLSILVDSKGLRLGFTPDKSSPYLEALAAQILFDSLKPYLLLKGKFVTEDLNALIKNHSEPKSGILKLHRNKVKDYLQNCSADDTLGQILESLRYITQNKKILDDKLNINIDFEKLSKPKDFKIPIGKKGFSFAIQMPYVDEWKNLIAYLEKITPAEKEKKAKEFFHNEGIKNAKGHKTVGRKMSLPVDASPSGGFRIQRQNEFKETIFQVQAGESANIGFFQNEKKSIDFGRTALSLNYRNRNVRPYLLEDKILGEETDIIYFDSQRNLNLTKEQKKEGILEIKMSPGTKARCFLYIRISAEIFFSFFKTKKSEKFDFSKLYNIPLSKKKDQEGYKELSKFLDENVAKQRDFITITRCNSNFVELEFVSDGYPSSLKTLYNAGTPVISP